jgi:hypothetical protein
MVRHVVLLRFAATQSAADIDAIFHSLKQLQNHVDGILNISVGVNSSPEGLQRGYTHGFTVDFKDEAARDAYLPHPEHQKVGAMIVAATEGGIDGVLVVDWVV